MKNYFCKCGSIRKFKILINSVLKVQILNIFLYCWSDSQHPQRLNSTNCVKAIFHIPSHFKTFPLKLIHTSEHSRKDPQFLALEFKLVTMENISDETVTSTIPFISHSNIQCQQPRGIMAVSWGKVWKKTFSFPLYESK